MSGFVASVAGDAEAVAPNTARLLQQIAVRGPDAQRTWDGRGAVLGHATLDAGDHPIGTQPLTIDGRTWIVADARLDDRGTLHQRLGIAEDPAAGDAELILRAFARWDERVTDYLLGDYAFAIWDASRRRLFCARDHLGTRPLYYARAGDGVVVASALAAVRAHPAVESALNDVAIADFLLFGFAQDASTTAFRDIHRLPPAHTLIWQDGRIRIQRYWTLPIEEPLELRRDAEYVERLTELLDAAVADRLGHATRVSVFMSGGIDSTLLAATLLDVLRRRGHDSSAVRAFTIVHGALVPDNERTFATAAAQALGVPLEIVEADNGRGWPPIARVRAAPEPVALDDSDADARCYAGMAAQGRIGFYGEGPDNALVYEWRRYLAYLWQRRRYGRLAADAIRFARHHRRLPLIGTLRTTMGRRGMLPDRFPSWIDPGLAERLDLQRRWADAMAPPDSAHPIRPRAHASLVAPIWQSVFDSMDPAVTGVPVDFRHPYLDLRLLRFLLKVPVIPWCREKHLLREALRGRVPESIRRRPKTPLAADPVRAKVLRDGLPPLPSASSVQGFGSLDAVERLAREPDEDLGAALRLVALGHWIEGLGEDRAPYLNHFPAPVTMRQT